VKRVIKCSAVLHWRCDEETGIAVNNASTCWRNLWVKISSISSTPHRWCLSF